MSAADTLLFFSAHLLPLSCYFLTRGCMTAKTTNKSQIAQLISCAEEKTSLIEHLIVRFAQLVCSPAFGKRVHRELATFSR